MKGLLGLSPLSSTRMSSYPYQLFHRSLHLIIVLTAFNSLVVEVSGRPSRLIHPDEQIMRKLASLMIGSHHSVHKDLSRERRDTDITAQSWQDYRNEFTALYNSLSTTISELENGLPSKFKANTPDGIKHNTGALLDILKPSELDLSTTHADDVLQRTNLLMGCTELLLKHGRQFMKTHQDQIWFDNQKSALNFELLLLRMSIGGLGLSTIEDSNSADGVLGGVNNSVYDSTIDTRTLERLKAFIKAFRDLE